MQQNGTLQNYPVHLGGPARTIRVGRGAPLPGTAAKRIYGEVAAAGIRPGNDHPR